MTRRPTAWSCAEVRAASSRLARGVVPALVLAALLAGVLLGVARLLLAVVLPAESELQQFLSDLARSQTVGPEP